jgi:putative peptidoglycan binding protein
MLGTKTFSMHLLLLSLVGVFSLPISANAAAANSQNTPAFSFSENHQLWDRGADIQSLQQFLNAQGFFVAQSGAGSPAEETTFFGLRTYRALLKYQEAHNLPPTGFFWAEDESVCLGIERWKRADRNFWQLAGIVPAIWKSNCASCRYVTFANFVVDGWSAAVFSGVRWRRRWRKFGSCSDMLTLSFAYRY